MLNIGVIGYGFIGKIHAQNYKNNPNVKEVIISESTELGRNEAEKAGFKVYENYEEILNSEKIDAVSICTPHNTHEEARKTMEVIFTLYENT